MLVGLQANAQNVGVGTQNPTHKLHVAGTLKTDTLIVTTNAGSGKVLSSNASGLGIWQNPPSINETDPKIASTQINRVPRWNGTALVDGIISKVGTLPSTTVINGGLQITGGGPNSARVLTATDESGNASWQKLVDSAQNYGFALSVTTTISFLGQTIYHYIPAGKKVMLTATQAFGSTTAGGAKELRLYAAYRPLGGSLTIVPGTNTEGIRCQGNTRHTETITHIFSDLPAGWYDFGMAGYCFGVFPEKWNYNGNGYSTLVVFN